MRPPEVSLSRPRIVTRAAPTPRAPEPTVSSHPEPNDGAAVQLRGASPVVADVTVQATNHMCSCGLYERRTHNAIISFTLAGCGCRPMAFATDCAL
jgi:hypothetical protein